MEFTFSFNPKKNNFCYILTNIKVYGIIFIKLGFPKKKIGRDLKLKAEKSIFTYRNLIFVKHRETESIHIRMTTW